MFSRPKCLIAVDLTGKTCIVTGANTGIGKETAAELARRGAHVIMACRSAERGNAAKQDILKAYGSESKTAFTANVANDEIKKGLRNVTEDQLQLEDLDLASLESVRAFAERFKDTTIDYLINNAGIMACPYGETKDGFEMQIGTNHLGPMLLTELLLPSIKRAAPGSRIVSLSSYAHFYGKINPKDLNLKGSDYGRMTAYSQSKLANVIYMKNLAKRLVSDDIKTASVHPGAVATDLLRIRVVGKAVTGMLRPFLKSPWLGAQTTLQALLDPDLPSGAYYADCAVTEPCPLALDEKVAEQLMTMSATMVGLDPQSVQA